MLNFALGLVGLNSNSGVSSMSPNDSNAEKIEESTPAIKKTKVGDIISLTPIKTPSSKSSEAVVVRKLGTSPFLESQMNTKLFRDENGYTYNRDQTVKSGKYTTFYYRCNTPKCRGRYIKKIQDGDIVVGEKLKGSHDGDICKADPEGIDIDVQKFTKAVYNRVQTSSISVKRAYEETMRETKRDIAEAPVNDEEFIPDSTTKIGKFLKAVPH